MASKRKFNELDLGIDSNLTTESQASKRGKGEKRGAHQTIFSKFWQYSNELKETIVQSFSRSRATQAARYSKKQQYVPGTFPSDDGSYLDVKMFDTDSSDDEYQTTSSVRRDDNVAERRHSMPAGAKSILMEAQKKGPTYDKEYMAIRNAELERDIAQLTLERDKRKEKEREQFLKGWNEARQEKQRRLEDRRREAEERDREAALLKAQKEREEAERKKEEERKKAEEAARAAAAAQKSTVILDLPEKDLEDIDALWNSHRPDPRDAEFLSETSGLSVDDLKTALPGTWLNDQIVNQVLKVITQRVKQQKKYVRGKRGDYNPPPIHCFDTHMFNKFDQEGWSAVQRWWSQVGLNGTKMLKCPLVVIPINSGAHWTLAIIDGVNKTARYYDSLSSNRATEMKLKVLQRMVHNNLGSDYDESDWTYEAGFSHRQCNGDDCGVFTVCNALAVIAGKNPKDEVKNNHMVKARQMICWIAYYNAWYEEGKVGPVRRHTKFSKMNGATTNGTTTNGDTAKKHSNGVIELD